MNRHFRRIAAIVLALTMVFSTVVTVDAQTAIVKKPALPQISARSAIVIDGDSGKIIYRKNAEVKRYPYSTTKLLTVLAALDYLEPTDVVFIGKTAMSAPDKTGGFVYGEKVRVKDLVYAAMLPSANEAAVALAVAVSGSEKRFAGVMNRKAKELGCTKSNFTNPYGWLNKNHYSTARDMVKITRAAMKNPLIKKACSTEMYKIPATNKHGARWIATTNSFVAQKVYTKSGVFAGKTGTWDYSNATLASVCDRNGKVMYAVVFKDLMKNRYASTNSILNYSYKKLAYDEQIKQEEVAD